jgi:hypothetical protein
MQYHKNYDLMHRVGRLTIPSFYGSSKSSTSDWVKNMDTYLQLNPMTKVEAINISTLHLDGEAHEWWHRSCERKTTIPFLVKHKLCKPQRGWTMEKTKKQKMVAKKDNATPTKKNKL